MLRVSRAANQRRAAGGDGRGGRPMGGGVMWAGGGGDQCGGGGLRGFPQFPQTAVYGVGATVSSHVEVLKSEARPRNGRVIGCDVQPRFEIGVGAKFRGRQTREKNPSGSISFQETVKSVTERGR
ncbi:hypothetical protein chiPu_0020916 [Chiloscyllium punctatum]|uniref:Uncharacterized protein n=1 Tax=Chiloscyllium punctatum TaxID=137246 RepID=A0A401RLB2_CHIPU|nr:hypothetical protein [Chiloscyllium punctatum]